MNTSNSANLAAASEPRDTDGRIVPIHGPEDFEGMRRAGRLAAEALDLMVEHVRPGVTTAELDRICHEFIYDNGATAAPLNYAPRGLPPFPKSICTSVNHVVCHGIPSDKKRLVEGDVLNIDVTVVLDGWHGDSSRMYYAGTPKKLAQRLCDVTFDCLWRGIEAVRPGATLGDVGHAIQTLAEGERFSVVQVFCGHGLGRSFHAAPTVLHFGRPGQGMVLQPGMFFTIEPMINVGTPDVTTLPDQWTAVTKDRKLSAQFEHSIGVTEDGVEVFTRSPRGFDKPPFTA